MQSLTISLNRWTVHLVSPQSCGSVSAHDQDTAAFRQVLDSIDFDRALRGFWRRKIVVLFDEAIQSLNTRYTALNVSSGRKR